jgi:hypothetical protein
MSVRTSLSAIIAVVLASLVVDPAMAKTISIKGHKPDQVQGKCSGDGDVYFSKDNNPNGTYGCLHADGSGIVCGGYSDKYKKTCDTFRTASFPVPKVPTREEAIKAEAGRQ